MSQKSAQLPFVQVATKVRFPLIGAGWSTETAQYLHLQRTAKKSAELSFS
jgi:hypothetical protein